MLPRVRGGTEEEASRKREGRGRFGERSAQTKREGSRLGGGAAVYQMLISELERPIRGQWGGRARHQPDGRRPTADGRRPTR
eukprot:6390620-Prymnesium_polylepis.1